MGLRRENGTSASGGSGGSETTKTGRGARFGDPDEKSARCSLMLRLVAEISRPSPIASLSADPETCACKYLVKQGGKEAGGR